MRTDDRPDLKLLVLGIAACLTERRQSRENREYERVIERAIAENADFDDPFADLPPPCECPCHARRLVPGECEGGDGSWVCRPCAVYTTIRKRKTMCSRTAGRN